MDIEDKQEYDLEHFRGIQILFIDDWICYADFYCIWNGDQMTLRVHYNDGV